MEAGMTDRELNKDVIGNKYYLLMLYGVCKYCKHYTNRGKSVKNHTRHWCDKKESPVYEAYFCKKTDYLRGKLEVSL